ncbi:hypothetical protein AC578_2809 [Pseudocercospora eumusae]|uniref:Major facilitator superfamily (MFS) profile domain-containing protein n=1 Tax=Pseudocercospora eumusae TaxID=321146 RepID=A0A139HGZ4_9PEZI|nr:hypothetical protein AC578_2809 [Pseudocercospora eumusae]
MGESSSFASAFQTTSLNSSYSDSCKAQRLAWYRILFSGLTILLGVLAFFVLGTPREVMWLPAREKRMAAARVVANQTGTDREKHRKWKWSQVRIAFKHPQTCFFFVNFAFAKASRRSAIWYTRALASPVRRRWSRERFQDMLLALSIFPHCRTCMPQVEES